MIKQTLKKKSINLIDINDCIYLIIPYAQSFD